MEELIDILLFALKVAVLVVVLFCIAFLFVQGSKAVLAPYLVTEV